MVAARVWLSCWERQTHPHVWVHCTGAGRFLACRPPHSIVVNLMLRTLFLRARMVRMPISLEHVFVKARRKPHDARVAGWTCIALVLAHCHSSIQPDILRIHHLPTQALRYLFLCLMLCICITLHVYHRLRCAHFMVHHVLCDVMIRVRPYYPWVWHVIPYAFMSSAYARSHELRVSWRMCPCHDATILHASSHLGSLHLPYDTHERIIRQQLTYIDTSPIVVSHCNIMCVCVCFHHDVSYIVMS